MLGEGIGAATLGLEVGPIGNHVDMDQWRDAREIFIGNSVTVGPQLSDDAVDVDGVPNEHGIGKQAQATRLVHDLLVVASTERALVGEEQPSGETMAKLAAVKLKVDATTQWLVLDVAQDVKGLDRPAQGGERFGDAVGRAGVDQPLQNDMGGREPVAQRGGDADQLVPLLRDEGGIDGAVEQRLERAIVGVAIEPLENLIGQIGQPGHEVDAQ